MQECRNFELIAIEKYKKDINEFWKDVFSFKLDGITNVYAVG